MEAHVETPEEKADTHSRLVALFLVFAVVIFFWMAFHQNGLTLTYFARDFTQTTATGLVGMLFDVTNLTYYLWCRDPCLCSVPWL